MPSFGYAAPQRLDDLLAELSASRQRGERVQLLAGGTDLLVQMKYLDRAPRLVLDVKKVPEANRLEVDAAPIFIGAAIPAIVLTANAALKALYPGLVEAVDLIGSAQIQGRASIGGNLCNASPAGDTIPALIAAGGVCVIAGAGNGTAAMRKMPVESFVTGVGRHALADDEVLLGIELARPDAGTRDAFLRFIPRTEMDIAVASAGVSVTLDASGICTRARVAIGAVAPTALLVPAAAAALIGTTLDDAALDAAGRACSAAAAPISDKRGPAAYRRSVVAVLCRRAARLAAARAADAQTVSA